MKLVELSLWCVRKSNLERPYMRQVVQRLREIGLAPLPSMQRDGSIGESANKGEALRSVAAPPSPSPLGGWSTCNMVSGACQDPEKACDSRVCQVDHSLKRPIMYSYRTALGTCV